jgi:hypothetical protein
MKANAFPATVKRLVPLVALLPVLLGAALPEPAEEGTNATPSPNKHGLSFKMDFGNQASGATNLYGLPKEAYDRLSPEQIVELTKTHEPPAAVLIIITLAMFGTIVGCVALGVGQRLKRTRMLHETLRLMIEKGQPIPPELLQSPDGMRRPRNDLRNGLVFVSIGIGFGALLLAEHESGWPMALIPLLIGVALLVSWKLERKPNGQPK